MEEDGYIYTRLGNPNSTELEQKIALLEGAEAAVAAGSGMGAITSALWTALEPGDHVVAGKTLYGCTFASEPRRSQYGIETSFVDTSGIERKNVRPNTKLPGIAGNPAMTVSDIPPSVPGP